MRRTTAHERTFSLITQVVGRAGRRFDTGRAVIQTYSPLHPVILTAARQDYEAFYESEMQTREALRCPPVCDITMITAVGELEQQVLSSLLALKTRLQSLMEGQFADVKAPVLGRICMDMCMVRIPEGVDVHRGDEVTVFGPEGWTAEDAADAAGTISYEVLCAISRRVPRFYR